MPEVWQRYPHREAYQGPGTRGSGRSLYFLLGVRVLREVVGAVLMVDQEARRRSRFFLLTIGLAGCRPVRRVPPLRDWQSMRMVPQPLRAWASEFRPSGSATENWQLRTENRQLRAENRQLRAENRQLSTECREPRTENRELRTENHELRTGPTLSALEFPLLLLPGRLPR